MRKYLLDVIFLVFLALVIMSLFQFGRTALEDDGTAPRWSADFESGAAQGLHWRADGSLGFEIPAEPGGNEYLWFYFSVSEPTSQPLNFVLENAAGAHQNGSRWQITRPLFSADGRHWVRAAVTRYSRQFDLQHPWGRSVFKFSAPLLAETLYVAYFYPYTNEDLAGYLSKIAQYPGVQLSTLGLSEEGRSIALLRVGAPGGRAGGHNLRRPAALDSSAPQIWVICREHPGETPASFVCEGMIEALLNQPAGQRLRQAYEFYIIPILNVDGVAHGYYYHNARGVNLARDWMDFSSAEVRALLSALDTPERRARIRLVINLHSSNDPSKGHFFLVRPASSLQPEDAELQRAILAAVAGHHPQLQGRATVKLHALPAITGNALYRNYGVYCLYLESNYSRGADGSLVTPQSLREVGGALIQALAEVLRPE